MITRSSQMTWRTSISRLLTSWTLTRMKPSVLPTKRQTSVRSVISEIGTSKPKGIWLMLQRDLLRSRRDKTRRELKKWPEMRRIKLRDKKKNREKENTIRLKKNSTHSQVKRLSFKVRLPAGEQDNNPTTRRKEKRPKSSLIFIRNHLLRLKQRWVKLKQPSMRKKQRRRSKRELRRPDLLEKLRTENMPRPKLRSMMLKMRLIILMRKWKGSTN